MVADAPAKPRKRGSYACGRCGRVGHTGPRCPQPAKILHRCLRCAALVWDAERHIHAYDKHGLALREDRLHEVFEVAVPPVFNDSDTLE